MVRNNETNRATLAEEVVDSMELKTVLEFVKDVLESEYEKLSQVQFNRIWDEMFGDN